MFNFRRVNNLNLRLLSLELTYLLPRWFGKSTFRFSVDRCVYNIVYLQPQLNERNQFKKTASWLCTPKRSSRPKPSRYLPLVAPCPVGLNVPRTICLLVLKGPHQKGRGQPRLFRLYRGWKKLPSWYVGVNYVHKPWNFQIPIKQLKYWALHGKYESFFVAHLVAHGS